MNERLEIPWPIIVLALIVGVSNAYAATCGSGETLETGGDGADLEVTGGVCRVTGGTYVYGNVNIYNKGTLQFEDAQTDFWARSILVENTGTLRAGTPRDPIGTKGKGRNGTSSEVLTIYLYGADQGAQYPSLRQVRHITCSWSSPSSPPGRRIRCMSERRLTQKHACS
jgi:hypothetical protein